MSQDSFLEPTQTQKQSQSYEYEHQITTTLLDAPWGRLCACSTEWESVDLLEREYSVGRSPECKIVVKRDQLNVSKKHFTINRDINGLVYIYDHSKNGTFINGHAIGRGNKNILNSGDVLAIGEPRRRAYVFNYFDEINSFLPNELKRKYHLAEILGKGAVGEVRLCRDKRTCQPFAIKKIIKARSSATSALMNHPKRIVNEINILQNVSHPFIVGMREVIETNMEIFIVLEYMPDGDLENYISSRIVKEAEVKFIIYQLLRGVEYLHDNGITHRDLKPENILVSTKSCTSPHVKISDFGLSKIMDEESMMETTCGTLCYVAPEVVQRFVKYDKKVDVWSLGVILYYMLTKRRPINGSNKTELIINILRANIDWGEDVFTEVSRSACDLNRQMLIAEPNKRISIDDIFEHQWIKTDITMKSRVALLESDEAPTKRFKFACTF